MPTGWKKISTGSTGPRASRLLQRNWIGRSTGAEVDFFIGTIVGRGRQAVAEGIRRLAGRSQDRPAGRGSPTSEVLRIYTTRPDTLFGATYMVIAPEHPFVERLTTPEQADGGPRVLRTGGPQERSRPHRSGQGKDRRLHRLVCDQSGQRRGDSDLGRRLRADQLRHRRDHGRAGARHARLRVRQAVRAADRRGGRSGRGHRPRAGGELATRQSAGRHAWPFIADGTAINSGPYNGLTTAEFKQKIADDLAAKGIGRAGGQLQAPRLALQPAAFLGRAVPDPARTGRRGQADRPHPRAAARATCRSICRRR